LQHFSVAVHAGVHVPVEPEVDASVPVAASDAASAPPDDDDEDDVVDDDAPGAAPPASP